MRTNTKSYCTFYKPWTKNYQWRKANWTWEEMHKPTDTSTAHERPYFIWNADLTEQDVRDILTGDDDYAREQMIGHIVRNARFEDIWKYVTIQDVLDNWRVVRGFLWPPSLREVWAWALQVWGYDVPST